MTKLLLVEPDKILATTYSDFLQAHGHVVVCAFSAQAAIVSLDSFEPDLIILELQLPGHNGVEFLYELRSYTDLQVVPVLVHTSIPKGSFANADTVLAALGVTDYLYKSMSSLRQLAAAVANRTAAIT